MTEQKVYKQRRLLCVSYGPS